MMQSEPTFARHRQLARQQAFLAALEVSGNIYASAKQAGVCRQLVYYWKQASPAFERQLRAAANVAFKRSTSEMPDKLVKLGGLSKRLKSTRREA